MKIKLFSCLLLLLLGCKEKEEVKLYSGLITVQESNFGYTTDYFSRYVIGAEVTTYLTEADFWLERNPVHKGSTNEFGTFYLYNNATKHDPSTYWFKVKYNDKNNYRYILEHINDTIKKYSYLWPSNRQEHIYQAATGISPTPTKLKIKVFQNGNPVKGAQVDMYRSKEDYLNFIDFDTKGFLSYIEVDKICKNSFMHVFIKDTNSKIIKDSYRGETDTEGIASLCSLEPRKYWIRVRKDGKSNDDNFFEIDSLPDDVNVQNYYEIAIQ